MGIEALTTSAKSGVGAHSSLCHHTPQVLRSPPVSHKNRSQMKKAPGTFWMLWGCFLA
jgi:hypothetical protein